MRVALASLALGALAVAAGCAVGPDYARPAVDSPAQYRFAAEEAEESLADLAWWQLYTDETLQELIRSALENNYDIRIAVSRVERARAISAAAKSQFYPSFGYQGGITRGRNQFLGAPGLGAGTETSAVTVLTAAWELDVWGRIRRLNEAALAGYLATEEAHRAVRLSLVSEVAQAYLELLELDLELRIARDTTASFSESLRIFQNRLAGGIASNLETSRAEGALASTAAQVPELERLIAITENRINVLLGRNPAPIERSANLLDESVRADIPAGLPSALLERRPDILQSEQILRAASAEIGVAEAEFFPKIGLTAFMGKVSPELDAYTSGATNAWSIGANLAGPIFEGGRIKAQVEQAKAAWEQARLQYLQAALNAFQEVSNTLISGEKFNEAEVELARAVRAYEESVRVSTQRYLAGKAGYFEVLEAQQQLFPAQNALAQVQLGQRLVVVQLYKALGGGWQLPDEQWSGEPAPAAAPAE